MAPPMRTLGLALLFLSLAAVGSACSCIQPGSPTEELNRSDAVFSGTVTDIEQRSRYGLTVRFDTTEVWKGPNTSMLTVSTADNTAACGYPFEEGQQYLVYAHSDQDISLRVSLCSRTTALQQADIDLQALGNGTRTAPPSAPTSASPAAFLLTVLFLTAVAAITAAVNRYRR